jgi:hypothetical protein
MTERHEKTFFFLPADSMTASILWAMMPRFRGAVQFNLLFEFKRLSMYHPVADRMMAGQCLWEDT